MRFEVVVSVMPKTGIADPQGATIERALPALGFVGVKGLKVGKQIIFVLEASSEQEAASSVQSMCERLLSNPVIEDFRFEVQGGSHQ